MAENIAGNFRTTLKLDKVGIRNMSGGSNVSLYIRAIRMIRLPSGLRSYLSPAEMISTYIHKEKLISYIAAVMFAAVLGFFAVTMTVSIIAVGYLFSAINRRLYHGD